MNKTKQAEAKKTKSKKLTFKQRLTTSGLEKRISLTKLETLADNLEQEEALKEILSLLNPFFRVCSLKDFKEISLAINSLCQK